MIQRVQRCYFQLFIQGMDRNKNRASYLPRLCEKIYCQSTTTAIKGETYAATSGSMHATNGVCCGKADLALPRKSYEMNTSLRIFDRARPAKKDGT